jgi:alpha-L-fucosidase 2
VAEADDRTALTFTAPATEWLECLPLGDGRLGVMCDGGVGTESFHLNDETAWSGSPASEAARGQVDAVEAARVLAEARRLVAEGDRPAAGDALRRLQGSYSQAYLPFGELTVAVEDTTSMGYRRSLTLATATHEVAAGGLVRRSFVSRRRGVFVHTIAGASGLPSVGVTTPLRELARRVEPDRVEIDVRLPSDVAPGHEPQLPPASWSDAPGAALEGVIVARVVRDASGLALVVVATGTTFPRDGGPITASLDEVRAAARERVEAAVAVGATVLLDEHERDHRALFDRVTLEIHGGPQRGGPERGAALDTTERFAEARRDPAGTLSHDPDLARLLFDYGRYLLISSSRPGGLPATLQGIWNDSMQPPWSSNYTVNINTEMNYWGAHVADLSETAEPLADLVLRLAEAGRDTARRLYDAPGWVVHHNTDAWAFTDLAGSGSGDPRWAFWPMGAPWLLATVWESVAFGAATRADVERLWPAIREAARFALAWHHVGEDGVWGTSPATSPENAFVESDGRLAAVDRSSTLDLSLVRELFRITVDASERLGFDADEVARDASARLALLPASPAVDGGRLREWDSPRDEEDPQHRHVSPLFGLHPGAEHWDDERRRAAAAMLDRRGDESTGWSLVWKLALWARLGRGDKVSDLLALVVRDARSAPGQWSGGLYPNLFAAHPPFQVDGNLGFVGALAETLLQSHDGIHLLPAVPRELGTGRVDGLVARPGVRVSMRWTGGLLERADLTASSDVPHCRIRSGDRTVVRDLAAGETTSLTPSDFDADTIAQRSAPAGAFRQEPTQP